MAVTDQRQIVSNSDVSGDYRLTDALPQVLGDHWEQDRAWRTKSRLRICQMKFLVL
jgi:hypothetical protein